MTEPNVTPEQLVDMFNDGFSIYVLGSRDDLVPVVYAPRAEYVYLCGLDEHPWATVDGARRFAPTDVVEARRKPTGSPCLVCLAARVPVTRVRRSGFAPIDRCEACAVYELQREMEYRLGE